MKRKRFLAGLLSAAMIFGIMSFSVFADENVAQINDTYYSTLEAAFAAVKENETVTINVLEDSEGNGIIVPVNGNRNITVNFNNHTYNLNGTMVGSSTNTATNGFQLYKGNTITFKNGTVTSSVAKTVIQNYSTLTLDSMNISCTRVRQSGDNEWYYGVGNNNASTLITGNTNISVDANDGKCLAFDVYANASGYPDGVTVTLDENMTGTITGKVQIWNDGVIEDSNKFNLIVKSGTFSSDIVDIRSTEQKNFKFGAISGGTFANDVSAFCADGYKAERNSDGTYGVETIKTAQIGNNYYSTFEAAINAAADGDTIVLLMDASGDGIGIEPDRFTNGITIDLNNHTYTVTGNLKGSSNSKSSAFWFNKGNTITIKNGTLTSSETATWLSKDGNTYKAAMLVQNHSDNLTLENVTLDGWNLRDKIGSYALSNDNGNVFINNSIIASNPDGENSYAFDVDNNSAYGAVTVTVTDDSQINGLVIISRNTTESSKASLKIGSNTYSENGNYVYMGTKFIKMDWTAETDSGYYMTDGAKAGIMRFIFNIDTNDTITNYGIKYVKAEDLSENIVGVNVSADGNVKSFYGDVAGAPESATGTYYAIGFVTIDGCTFWFDPVSCSINWNRLVDYTAGGVQ